MNTTPATTSHTSAAAPRAHAPGTRATSVSSATAVRKAPRGDESVEGGDTQGTDGRATLGQGEQEGGADDYRETQQQSRDSGTPSPIGERDTRDEQSGEHGAGDNHTCSIGPGPTGWLTLASGVVAAHYGVADR